MTTERGTPGGDALRAEIRLPRIKLAWGRLAPELGQLRAPTEFVRAGCGTGATDKTSGTA